MSKIVLIKRGSKSDWISCQSITSNIEKAYGLLYDKSDLEIVELNNEDNQYEQWLKAKAVTEINPAFISFIDHQPHPQSFLKSLAHLMGKIPSLLFHVFGDFTLQTNDWLEIAPLLNETPTSIITASPKQKALVQNLMSGKKDLVSVIPFPIDTDFFTHERKKQETDHVTFLYTGRLSTQKNILELITYFDQFNKNIAPNTKLKIAGPVDDLGIPFLGKNLNPGSYENTLEKQIVSLGNSNISLLRNCNHEELRELYRNSDFYLSMSTHNDEDYGMAPAEALSCGLPCILSDWGGFSGFSALGAKMVPVTEKNERILPQGELLIIELTEAINSVMNEESRMELSKKASEALSIESYSKALEGILKNKDSVKFEGFTPQMEMMAASHKINKDNPFFKGSNGGYSELYKDIYKPYFN